MGSKERNFRNSRFSYSSTSVEHRALAFDNYREYPNETCKSASVSEFQHPSEKNQRTRIAFMSDSENQQPNTFNDIFLTKEFMESSRREELQTLLADSKTSAEALFALIPAGQVLILILHTIGDKWEPLLEDMPAPVLEASRVLYELTRKYVPTIAEHPAVQQIIAEATTDDDEEETSEIDWRRITNISPSYWWIGDLGNLVPWVRIGFRNKRGELLLETTANFGDMAYLAAALTFLLKNNMQRALDAKKLGTLAIEPVKNGDEQIRNLLSHASEISELLKELSPESKTGGNLLES
jgi:hypothetical protein